MSIPKKTMRAVGYDKEDDRRQSAGKLEGLDLFE
jgi:hypothetical protein